MSCEKLTPKGDEELCLTISLESSLPKVEKLGSFTSLLGGLRSCVNHIWTYLTAASVNGSEMT